MPCIPPLSLLISVRRAIGARCPNPTNKGRPVMYNKTTIVGVLIVLALFDRACFAQAVTGAYDFGAAKITNTVAPASGGTSCGIFNTDNPAEGLTTIAMRGNGKTAAKFFMNDVSVYTTNA